jgi:hypothetical protein
MRFIVVGTGLALALAVAPVAFAQQQPTYHVSNGSSKIEPTYHPNDSAAMAQAQTAAPSRQISNGSTARTYQENNGAAAAKKRIQNQ